MRATKFTLSLATIIAMMGSAQAATEIQFWHSMEGALGERVNELVENFNKSQSDYVVKPNYKGNYGESMNAGIAAFRAGNAPDILQVFEVGTATMMNAKGAIQPVQEMSELVGDPIDPSQFLGPWVVTTHPVTVNWSLCPLIALHQSCITTKMRLKKPV